MRRILVTVTTLALTLGLMGSVAAVQDKNFSSHLTGSEEVPSNESGGQGQVILRVSRDAVQYKLITANLDNITAAHIHCGGPEINGPVVVFLFGPDLAPDQNGILSQGSFDAGDFTPPATRQACADILTIDDLVEAMATGEAYVNVHTTLIPGGEIRGNLP